MCSERVRIPRVSAKLTEDFDWRLERRWKEEAMLSCSNLGQQMGLASSGALSAAAPRRASRRSVSQGGHCYFQIFSFKEKNYFYLCVYMCLCMCVYVWVCVHMGSRCPKRPKKGVGVCGAGVTVAVSPHVDAENQTQALGTRGTHLCQLSISLAPRSSLSISQVGWTHFLKTLFLA